jgi:ring-1,2-phenylacetyl-CoA epoxidase subunit PaaB
MSKSKASSSEAVGQRKVWPLWEVFIRAKNGLSHRHAGSVHAADAKMALEAARDTYTRRMEGVSLWVVPSAAIIASDPGDAAELFEPAADKVYRHPTFYVIPDNIKNI